MIHARLKPILLFAWLVLLAAPAAHAAAGCVEATPACRESFEIAPGRVLPLYRTHALGGRHAGVSSAVIVIHGVLRNAGEYFSWMVEAASAAGVSDSSAIVSPHFMTIDDQPQGYGLRWPGGGWKHGDDAVGEPALSSFDALDAVVRRLTDRNHFPDLRRLVVIGHSAGGQMVSRYVAASPVRPEHGEVAVRYVIANPSTYLYLSPERSRPDQAGEFEVPPATDCADYDDYPYGVRAPNRYVAASSAEERLRRVRARDIAIFLGERDTETEYLDLSCGARLQGKHRFDRGRIYHEYLRKLFRPASLKLVTVPGVGHVARDMFVSRPGLDLIFAFR